MEPRDHGLEYEEDVRPQPRLTRPCAAWRRESRRLPVNRGEITTRSGRHQTSGGSWQRQNRPRRSATKPQSDGLLERDEEKWTPVFRSRIPLETPGIDHLHDFGLIQSKRCASGKARASSAPSPPQPLKSGAGQGRRQRAACARARRRDRRIGASARPRHAARSPR